MSDTFCSLLWNHIQLNATGNCKPCCRFSDTTIYKDYKNNLHEAFYSKEANKIRKDMLAGKSINGCEKCYRDESSTKQSMRTQNNEKFNINVDNPKIEYLELIPSNICNFSCVMCNLTSSSEWYDDTVYLQEKGFIKTKNVDRYNSNYLNLNGIDLSNLVELKLLGGEPFFEKENIKLLEKIKEFDRLKKLTFHTHTNASFIPTKEWQHLLSEINSIILSISMEGYEKYNEYIRYGSRWKTTYKVLKFWNEFSYNKNIQLKIHCVVNNYNLFHINDFEVWCKKNFPNIMLNFDVLDRPEYLCISNLPLKYKQKAAKTITHDKILNVLFKQDSKNMFNKFKTYTKLFEQKRKNSISSFDINVREMLYE